MKNKLTCDNSKWVIENGILFFYRGRDRENVIVPEGVEGVKDCAIVIRVENITFPKSTKMIDTYINVKTLTIYDTTILTRNTLKNSNIEEIRIINTEDNVLSCLSDIINTNFRGSFYFKKIVILGNQLKPNDYKILADSLSRVGAYLDQGEEFIIHNGVLYDYNGTYTDVIIPEGVTRIAYRAFYNKGLTSVILPESLEEIGGEAFAENNIKIIVIPNNVKRVDSGAFSMKTPITEMEIGVNTEIRNHQMTIRYLNGIRNLTINCENITDDFIIEKFLNEYISELTNLKQITIKNHLVPYAYIRNILNNIKLSNIEIATVYSGIIQEKLEFSNGKLNNITIYENFELIQESALKDAYKLYIDNRNGKTVRQFIDYIKTNNITKPKNLSMIVILGQNISFLEKLEINKSLGKILFYDFNSEVEEFTQNNINLDDSIEDKEINDVLKEITSILELQTNVEDKNKILIKINSIIKKYREDLKGLKPKLFDEENSFGTSIKTPDELRNNLILELNKIALKLKANSVYLNLRNKINELEKLINEKTTYIPNEIITTIDKTKYIVSVSNKYPNHQFNKKLTKIFEKIKSEISKKIVSTNEDIILTNESPLEKTLTLEIDKLYEETKRINLIEETFNNVRSSELASDIETLKEIISNFSIEHQTIYNEKLNSIIGRYYQELISKTRKNLNETILELRKELMPLLEELNIKAIDLTQFGSLIDELNNEKNDRISTIDIITQEITSLIHGSNLTEKEKQEINVKLNEIISTWKNKLISSYEIKEEKDIFFDISKNLNMLYVPRKRINSKTIEIEIQIAKDLLDLKNTILEFIIAQEEYKKIEATVKNLRV